MSRQAGLVVLAGTLLSASLASEAGAAASCPTPAAPVAEVRNEYPIVGNYRQVLAAAHCTNLRCAPVGYITKWAQIDDILFDRSRPALSAADIRFVLADQRVPPALLSAERAVERRQFRQAFRIYLDDFTSNASAIRTLFLDDAGGTEQARSVLEQLGRRPATAGDARILVDVANAHKDEFAPLLYLGAVLLELGCKQQALHVYRLIPYVRPVVKSTYSGVTDTAMRLALSIDPNAWRRSPADQPSRPDSNPPGQ
jgi:hypothetical protein